MATHSSVLARESPWTEEPGGLQSLGLQSDTTERLTHFLGGSSSCTTSYWSSDVCRFGCW